MWITQQWSCSAAGRLQAAAIFMPKSNKQYSRENSNICLSFSLRLVTNIVLFFSRSYIINHLNLTCCTNLWSNEARESKSPAGRRSRSISAPARSCSPKQAQHWCNYAFMQLSCSAMLQDLTTYLSADWRRRAPLWKTRSLANDHHPDLISPEYSSTSFNQSYQRINGP